ncbi:hypothetical protein ACFX43_17195 [Nocardioides sp. YIM B13467]|uniref:hypothetical protein n=1 Tax=Nocardioides sp. YIM B13467 TaxID=3366294 RepID=UPI00366C5494
MDWQETLERAIPQPPPTHPDPAALLADGKKLVRRRRLAVVAGTAAAVAAVVGIGTVVIPSRDTATPNPPIATQSTAEDWPPEADIPLSDLAPVAYDFGTGETTLQKGWTEVDRVGPFTSGNSLAVAATNGEKTIYAYFESPSEISFTDASRTLTKDFQTWAEDISLYPLEAEWSTDGKLSLGDDGWRVVREIPNPMGYAAPWDSIGAVVERDGLERWILLRGTLSEDGESYGDTETYAIPGQTIEEWLTEAEEADRRDYRPGGTGFEASQTEVVEFGSDSEVIPAKSGVTIVEQAAGPDISESFSDGTSRTAAARITVGDDEQYVLVREKGGTTQAFSYSFLPAPRAADRRPLTLDEFAGLVKDRTPTGAEMWR